MSIAKQLVNSPVIYLNVESVMPNPYQPRKFFEKSQLEDLANSIREYGVIQPISVRLINGVNYELVAGERRLRASKLAGVSTIPAIVININDQDSAIIAIIENLQRQDLNFLEEAEGLFNLANDYNFTQEQLAERIGKKQSTIANKLRILKLPTETLKTIVENGLTERHARALLKLPNEKLQKTVLERVIKENYNVQKTENYIEALLQRENLAKQKPNIKMKTYIKDAKLFKNTIKQAVDMMNDSGITTVCDVEENGDGFFVSIMVSYS